MKDTKESSYLQEDISCIPSDRVICPICGKPNDTIKDGNRDRTYIDRDTGEYCTISVKKWYCKKCKKYFTELPKFLMPYKRYMKKEVEAVIKNYITNAKVSYLFCSVVSLKQQYIWVAQFLKKILKLSFSPQMTQDIGVFM
jgi:hypothetical protein